MPRKLIVLLLVAFLMAGSIFVGCGPSRGTAEWHVSQAYKLTEQGHYDEAIEECNRAIVLNPDCVEAYNMQRELKRDVLIRPDAIKHRYRSTESLKIQVAQGIV